MTPEQLPKAIFEAANTKELALSLHRAAQLGVTVLKRKSPVDQGIYKNAWLAIGFTSGSGIVATIENDAPYAGIIERGARPHKVSAEGREMLALWVARKFGLSGQIARLNSRIAKGTSALERGKVRAGTADRVATAVEASFTLQNEIYAIVEGICHKLAVHGQAPKWVVKSSLRELNRIAGVEYGKALARLLLRSARSNP